MIGDPTQPRIHKRRKFVFEQKITPKENQPDYPNFLEPNTPKNNTANKGKRNIKQQSQKRNDPNKANMRHYN